MADCACMTFAWLYLAIGFVLLGIGAEALVRGSASIASRFGVRPVIVGLTIVAFGTSAPELGVSVRAALAGSGGIALGNVIGSNIANIALVMAIAALLRPLAVELKLLRIDIPIALVATLALVAMMVDGSVSRLEGGVLFAGILAYTGLNLVLALRERNPRVEAEYEQGLPADPRRALWLDGAMIVAGLVLLVVGADRLVAGAVDIASAFGVSDLVIGLTLVALGTSLPELATTVVATWRGEGDIVVGNLVGSCIFNLLCIVGAAALARPLDASSVGRVDVAVLILVAVGILPLARTGLRLGRAEAVLLLAVYVGYIAWLATTAFAAA